MAMHPLFQEILAPFAPPSLEDQIEDIRSEIDRLRLTAETGEQWADICLLEERRLTLVAIQTRIRLGYSQERK